MSIKKPLELPNLKEDVDDFILKLLGEAQSSNSDNISYVHRANSDTKENIESLLSNDQSTQIDEDLNNQNYIQVNINNDSILSPTTDIKNLYKTPTNSTPSTPLNNSNQKDDNFIDKISPIPIYHQTPTASPILVTTTTSIINNNNSNLSKNNNGSLNSSLLDSIKSNGSSLTNLNDSLNSSSSNNNNKSDSITKNLFNEFSLELNNNSQNSSINDSNKSSERKDNIIVNVLDSNEEFESTQQPSSQIPITQSQPTQTSSLKKKRINYDLVTGKPIRPLKMIKGYLTPIKNNIINNNNTSPIPSMEPTTPKNIVNNNNNSIPSFQTLLKNHLMTTNNIKNENNTQNQQDNSKFIENTQPTLNIDSIPPPVTQYDMDRCFDQGGSDDEDETNELCVICQEPYNQPHEAPCHHLCCLECWKKWLSLKLECPVCRERTRIKQLKRV